MSDKISSVGKIEGWLVEKYSSTPYIQALAALVVGAVGTTPNITPFLAGMAGTALVLIDAGFRDMVHKRQEILFDELAKGEQLLSAEVIKNEDFLHAFFVTYRAAIRNRQKEKIQRFARILLTGVQTNNLDSDDLEEFVGILDALSDRELQLLKLLKQWEDQFPLQINSENNELLYQFSKYWSNFKLDAERQLSITAMELPSRLESISRTGLYVSLAGTLWDLEVGEGILTPRFSEFIKWIENENLADL